MNNVPLPQRPGDKAFTFTYTSVPTCFEISLGIAEMRTVLVTGYGKTRTEARRRAGVK